MEEKKKMVPELRFPEFKDTDGWKEKPLNELGKLVNGLTYSPDDIREDGLLVLRSSNIQNGQIVLDDKVYVRTDIKGANLSEQNDILICVRNGSKALIGKNAIIPEGMPLSTHGAFMTVFRSDTPNFVFQLFQTDEYDRQVAGDLGATINSINGSNFLKYKFHVPTNPPEQQKIADCLSSLDDLITAESGKLETLKAHKKGLMQQLFPAEGETVPKLRFAEFRESGEWEEKTLSKLGTFTGGGTPSKAVGSYWDGEVPWISSSDITEDSIFKINISRFITEEAIQDSATKKVPANSILLVSRVGVGKLAITKESLCTSQDFTNFTPQADNLIFLSYYLKAQSNLLLQFSQGMAIKGFTKEDISKLILFIPGIKEQQKIADCLSSLDNLIESQT
jgi:type I restriction enzyme S subunit